ncbi:MAG: Fic family protein [Clostridia bacterium]
MKEIGMHTYDYRTKPLQCLTPEIVAMIAYIHENKGRQELFIEANIDELNMLLDVAKIQSTGASNRIEGIFTTDKRLEELVCEKSEPRNRSEQEIAGYREVLATIHESYEFINPRPNIILQLHRDLYSYSKSSVGGTYKNSDNEITEVDANGKQITRFTPVPAFQTPEAIMNMCDAFLAMTERNTLDALILIPMFILDFLCIHPFNDGNGRMSRLLTLLLLYKAGYIVGKYISLEMLIEKTKDTYYEALQESSQGWHEDENRYEPFVKYYLGILLKAYDEFENRIEHLKYRRMSKPDRIKAVIDRKVGKITKKEIMEYCPDISKVTVERTLTSLVKSGYIKIIGAGPASAYVKSDEKGKIK